MKEELSLPSLDRYDRPIISEEWIWSSFRETVRLNSTTSIIGREYPKIRQFPEVNIGDNFDLNQLSAPSVYPNQGFFNVLVKHHGLESTVFDTSSQILTLLLDKTFRNGPLELLSGDYINGLRNKINGDVRENKPIQVVMLTLPFKDQNPMTTAHRLSYVDLGEHVFFARLGRLANSISEIYQPGCLANIVSDGVAYADIFADNNIAGAEDYRQNCEQLIRQLGLSSSVKLFDMAKLINQDSGFNTARSVIRNIIAKSLNGNDERNRLFRAIRRGMMFNMKQSPPFDTYDNFSNLANLTDEEIDKKEHDVMEKLTEATLHYASILLTFKQRNLVETHFPNAIRTTARPTVYGRLGLRMTRTGLAVYNGVPVVDQSVLEKRGNLIDATYCFRLWEVFRHPEAVKIIVGNDTEPFCYTVPKLNS